MYNAMASFEGRGSKGSTRLHMDMADAVNVMMYASSTPEGGPGGAVWDLFKAEDADTLREFLRKKFGGECQDDPIHSQVFYVDNQLRQELFKEYGVQSHRIFQIPGQAVFIPAGCAHQVCMSSVLGPIPSHALLNRYATSQVASKSPATSSVLKILSVASCSHLSFANKTSPRLGKKMYFS